ncbi:MAG: metabolite traffic protein EboE [Gammaproteobacteria bacterium]|nr:metabolite traffic protein EboE [Gammaproteobacteria bacterium]
MPSWKSGDIAYCSNVHPGITPNEIERNLYQISATVREQLNLAEMNIGLWINAAAAQAYQAPGAKNRLKQCLATNKLQVVSLNGFPQDNFHQPVVKHKVYLPSWDQPARLHYTSSIADILAECLPKKLNQGTISTLPLAYRHNWTTDKHRRACDNLCHFVLAMRNLEDRTGKHIRLCLEMEPGCVLERTTQLINLFNHALPAAACRQALDQSTLKRYLGVCYDVCHQAIMQEVVGDSIKALQQADITIGKIQLSSALKVSHPANTDVRTRLAEFVEPKYLHQVSTLDANGIFLFKDDLIDALRDTAFPTTSPWWIHFHLPVQIESLDTRGIATTHQHIEHLLDVLSSSLPYAPHLEVETYTWHVLPFNRGLNKSKYSERIFPQHQLIKGIVGELAWLHQKMAARALI